MLVNELPVWDMTDNPTGCCPRFDPQVWEDRLLHWRDKVFVRATTRSLFHIPLDMGPVFRRTYAAIEAAGAQPKDGFAVLSRDLSPWSAEHLFAVGAPVPDLESVRLSGTFRTKVFEGPYARAPQWIEETKDWLADKGERAEEIYFFYTTCPKCAKSYGRNYVVAVARLTAAA